MTDREEREKHLDWLCRLKSNLEVFIPKDFHLEQFEKSLEYAISVIKADQRYDYVVIPENATNGDAIKALFPNKQFVSISSSKIYDFTTDNKIDCDLKWRDEPYREISDSKHEYEPYITLDELKELRDKIKAEYQYRFESAAYFEVEAGSSDFYKSE